MNVLSIALNTFREAVRDKIMYLLAGFGVVMILASRAVGWVSYGGELKITTDLGLVSIWLFTALISIFIGTGMIYKEIDKRTLYTILSKPIQRWEFLLGKYFGLLLTSYTCLTLLSVIFIGYLWLIDAPLTGAIIQALTLSYVEMAMMTSMALFFSSVSSPVLSALFTFALFAIGQTTKWIVEMGEVASRTSPVLQKLVLAVYVCLPNLHNFNVRQQAVHAAGRGEGWAIDSGEMLSVCLYGFAYTAAVLLATILVFRRKNF